MAAQLLASVLTDPSIGGLPTYVFIIIAAAVLIIGIIILIAVSRAGTKKAKKKATRIIEETPQPAPDNEEAAPETQDVPVAEIPDVTTTVGDNEEVNLSTLPEDSSVGSQTIEEEQPAQQAQPAPQPVYQQPVQQPEPQPEPQPVYQQPVQQPEPQPVYQQPVQQPEPQPAPVQEAAAAPQPEAVVVAPVKPKRVPPVRKKAEPAAAAAATKQPSNVTILFDLPENGGVRGKYVIVRDTSNPDRPYKFQLKANNGQILYESENYKSKPQSKSIKAFRNTLQNGTYTIDSEKNGTFRYKLFKPDGVTLQVQRGGGERSELGQVFRRELQRPRRFDHRRLNLTKLQTARFDSVPFFHCRSTVGIADRGVRRLAPQGGKALRVARQRSTRARIPTRCRA